MTKSSIFITGRYLSYECHILEDGQGQKILDEGLDEDEYEFLDGGETGLADATIMDGETVVETVDFGNIKAPKVHLVTNKWCLLRIESGKISYKPIAARSDFDKHKLSITPYIDSFSGYTLNYVNIDYNDLDLDVDFSNPKYSTTLLIDDKGVALEFGE